MIKALIRTTAHLLIDASELGAELQRQATARTRILELQYRALRRLGAFPASDDALKTLAAEAVASSRHFSESIHAQLRACVDAPAALGDLPATFGHAYAAHMARGRDVASRAFADDRAPVSGAA